jgi:hypothetical protein
MSAVVEVAPAPLAFDPWRARSLDLQPRDWHSVKFQLRIGEFPAHRAVTASDLNPRSNEKLF